MNSQAKKYSIALLQLIVTCIFLYFTFHNIQWSVFLKTIHRINYYWLLASLIPQFFSIYFLAAREKYLLKKLFDFDFITLLKGVLLGLVGNNILPFRGGEFIKVLYWSKQSDQSYVSLLSVAFLERMLDMLVLLFLFLFSSKIILAQLKINIVWGLIGFISVVILISMLFLLDLKYQDNFTLHHVVQRILGKTVSTVLTSFLKKIMVGFRVLNSIPCFLFAGGFTLLYWCMSFLCMAFFLCAFHLPISFEKISIILLATSLGSAIPAAPGYIGTYDYFAKTALVFFGVNVTLAASFALVTHLMLIVPITLVGLFFIYPILLKTANR